MDTLRALVISSGLRQTHIARKMGINHTLLSHWLCGRRKVPLLKLEPLADALNLPLEQVAGAYGVTLEDIEKHREAKGLNHKNDAPINKELEKWIEEWIEDWLKSTEQRLI